jgi:ketopantoate reductase
VYNACLNPICAITGLDTGRIRLADGAAEGLVKPAMREIVAAAKANGVVLADDVVEVMIEIDPVELYLSPSMLADVRKVRCSPSPILLWWNRIFVSSWNVSVFDGC